MIKLLSQFHDMMCGTRGPINTLDIEAVKVNGLNTLNHDNRHGRAISLEKLIQ